MPAVLPVQASGHSCGMGFILTVLGVIGHVGFIAFTAWLPDWTSSVAVVATTISILVPSHGFHHTHSPIPRSTYFFTVGLVMFAATITGSQLPQHTLTLHLVAAGFVLAFPLTLRALSRVLAGDVREVDGIFFLPGRRITWELAAARARSGVSYCVTSAAAPGGEVVRLGWDTWVLGRDEKEVRAARSTWA